MSDPIDHSNKITELQRERGTIAYISSAHIKHNLSIFKQLHPGKIIAVVKANAYGHGIDHVIPALQASDAYAVATIEEAIEIRQLDDNKKIMLLEGVFNEREMSAAIKYKFDVVIHQDYQIELLQSLRNVESQLDVWLKVNTGMHRLGFDTNDVSAKLMQLKAIKAVSDVRIMTHFASSEDISCEQTQFQIQANRKLKETGLQYSFSNTGAVLNQINDGNEWCRVGLGLFGMSPLPKGQWANDFNLKAVMHLTAKVIATNHIKAGEQVGYGGHFTASKDMRIAIVGIGYADGYPYTKSGSSVILQGHKVSVLGRVSMDMIAIDVSQFDDSLTGHEVTLWGGDLPIEAVAEDLQLIPYALTCGISKRVNIHVIQ